MCEHECLSSMWYPNMTGLEMKGYNAFVKGCTKILHYSPLVYAIATLARLVASILEVFCLLLVSGEHLCFSW